MGKFQRTVCVDFDGVLNDYRGWRGADVLGDAAPFVAQFLRDLKKRFDRVVVHTTREPYRVWYWLRVRGLHPYVDDVTPLKPPAIAYIDDRGICHRGDFDETIRALDEFQVHWQQ